MITFLFTLSAICIGGYVLLRLYLARGVCTSQARLDGKTVIITGANTGIGKETARDLAARGARVILACRDVGKAQKAADYVKESTGNENIIIRKLDLASLASVRQFAKEILEEESRLDILINNAGIMMCPQWETEDGFEMQMGTNHFGHFLLTMLLLDLIKKSAPSRIINLSSLGHNFAKDGIDFEDIHYKKSYEPTIAYARSKLANIYFTKELAKRLKGTGVTSYAVHPGAVETELGRNVSSAYPIFSFLMPLVQRTLWIWEKTPLQGAQTSIYCAVDENLKEVSGQYYSDCAEAATSKAAQDDAAAERLWDVSVKMVGLDDKKPEFPKFAMAPSHYDVIATLRIMMCPQWETEDGFEMQMGTNHFGHFLLTMLLLDLIKKSAPSRIINLSSSAHASTAGGIDFEDVHFKKSYSPASAYGRSKLANIYFTKELAKRLKGTGVTSYAVHPGAVETELGRNMSSAYPIFSFLMPLVQRTLWIWEKTPVQGAQTSIYCAVDESLSEVSGQYYSDCRETTTSEEAKDAAAAEQLWDISVKMVGLDE
ncbi:retinol dehydrogenase 11-like [Amphiura filiformis]|uniref:retinol dehydrogenase 11-like n=1 Tax=Amphiura filiformis TaxID=82378 RepID=UPI003B21FFF9